MTKKDKAEVEANNWELWSKQVDPQGFISKEEFDSLSIQEKVDFILAFRSGRLLWRIGIAQSCHIRT